MAKFTSMKPNISILPLLGLDKIRARQPREKLILGYSLGFKSPSCNALKKERKNSWWIFTEAYLLTDISCHTMRSKIMAGKSNEGFMFTHRTSKKASARVISSLIPFLSFFAIQGLNFPSHLTTYAAVVMVVVATTALLLKLKLLQIPKFWKWPANLLKGIKCVKDKPEKFSKAQANETTSAAPRLKWISIAEDLLGAVDVHGIDSFVTSICILLAWGFLCGLFLLARRLYSKNVRK